MTAIPRWTAALVLIVASSRLGAQSSGALVGRVSAEARGLDAAKVYAYELASQSLHKVTTDAEGDFRFQPLPSGLYKLIAFKSGFQPVIVMISRTVAQATSTLAQVVEMELAQTAAGASEDFWSLRGQVPSDVLRDLEGEGLSQGPAVTGHRPRETSVQTLTAAASDRFGANMMAMRGISGASDRPNETLQGRLGVDATIGGTSVDFNGRYTTLGEPAGVGASGVRDGQATLFRVLLENQDQGSLSVSALNHRMTLQRGSRDSSAMLDHYDVAWERDFGAARSTIRAEYTDENYLFGRGAVRSSAITDASRTLRLEGSYAEDFERHSIEAGLRYRQRDALALEQGQLIPAFGSERVDVFGRGGFRLTPSVMLEYGLFTTLQDGAVSLTPRGGVVIQISPQWEASGFYSERVQAQAGSGDRDDFVPTLRERQDDFAAASTREVQLQVSRALGQADEKLTLSAVHRQFGDNLRVYFGEDLFDFIENVYLVPGDSLPELQVSVSRRITSKVLTRFESSYAVGGGGLVANAAGHSFENDVSYLLTSVDTRFLPTATGVFFAFHRLEQDLLPLSLERGRGTSSELESVEMILTQDLNVILDLAADWSVRFDVEFSRGTDPRRPYLTDASRHRILGGVAVKF